MGVALADAFAARGGRVTLVLGPSSVRPSQAGVKVIDVATAEEMHRATAQAFTKCDILVAAAAVADFRPKQAAQRKVKKEVGMEAIELVPTKDILQDLASRKKKQFVVGFALETDDEMTNARKKLKTKNLDLIVLNSMNDAGAGFGHDTNKVTLIWRKGKVAKFGLMTKVELANKLADTILSKHA
jgi:phosphopantothenoylcysteine decarboxylase/phosphopantothenate--cysteine ligase